MRTFGSTGILRAESAYGSDLSIAASAVIGETIDVTIPKLTAIGIVGFFIYNSATNGTGYQNIILTTAKINSNKITYAIRNISSSSAAKITVNFVVLYLYTG